MKQQTTKTQAKKDPWDSVMARRVLKADVQTPLDSGKTAEQLQADIETSRKAGNGATGSATKGPDRRTVARADIYVAEQVFQWRGSATSTDQWSRRNHIHTLAKAINEQGKPLTHLLVIPVGQRFYVIDGHHRLAAYDTAGWDKEIPVEVFPGDLAAARLLALSCNVRDKLPMTTKAKSDAAWQIVKENLGGLTAQEIADRTGVSLRQVKYMKAAWKELPAALAAAAKATGKEPADPMELTWPQARDICQGKTAAAFTDEERETWKHRKAQEMVHLIQRTNVAAGIMKDMEVTALALQMLDGGLPAALMEQWASDYSEEIEELAARIAMPDDSPF
ncbi:ParB/RepB/Spo0J family partition protein [Bradyrhizobium diazoefficiens]|uniref:ParB/RepB/Spo0J family partition protein n=1 Tax=Bradyrhizobium diazoefficiens TaxID=1355477 RepID=UPI0027155F0E|nr:ParB/RepB/Spo0J family partition protein [Bradyrhizobium diazoefficiens]WLC16675.1 ParB/RepB/Spo0J family partition protein [Bradyrhizobium diazoefficiens]